MELISPLFVNIVALIAIVTGLALAGWWVVSTYWIYNREAEDKLPHVPLPDDIHEVLTGVPPALIIFYIFMLLTLVGYVLYIWLGGITY